jgi:Zn-dependent metalloprotease
VKRRIPLAVAVATAAVTATAAAMIAGPATAQPSDPSTADAAAARSASAFVAARPPALHASADEAYVQHPVISSGGMRYVPYDRTYKDLPVIGGDFVVAVNAAGQTTYTSVAQTHPIGALSIAPSLSQDDALAVAKRQLKTVTTVEGPRLVVVVAGAAAALAWETTVSGMGTDGVSRLTVDVDARTGSVLRSQEHVMNVAGTGNGWINGAVSLEVTRSSTGTYSMRDPNVSNLSCQNAATNTVFTSTDSAFGSGTSTDRETGCADAFYVAQTQNAMLSSWLGRNRQDGSGGAWPLRVGLNDENAYYDGTQVQIGHNTANQWIGSLDVVGHELGHGIDDHTPGGISGRGTQEFVADTFGAATEWFAKNPNDPPDFQVGEEVNLVGSGPIRYMYQPSLAGHSNCYSSSTPSQEVHAAAGPGNHWFYLLAEGTNPTNGQPSSPTCNSTSVTGLGIQTAIKIMYNAMLMKTTASSYLRYRVWTLQAAKNLFPNGCTEFNTVKAAWNAVSVPAQSDEPSCGGGPTTPPPSSGCTGSNGTDVAIPDAGAAVTSSITIAGCARAASSTSTVTVAIVHTYRGDLRVDLVAPDGSVYNLKPSSGSDGADNVNATYTRNLSSESANGTWGLRVQDIYSQDTGYINSWTLTV